MRNYKDPVTGDSLTLGEYVSWKVQGVIRRWATLLVIIAVTAICWATNNDIILTWWNLAASLLAIVIEFIVGLSMLGQTRRDACILREVRNISQNIEAILHHIRKTTDKELEELEDIIKVKRMQENK